MTKQLSPDIAQENIAPASVCTDAPTNDVLAERSATLDRISDELKAELFGIDHVIDRVVRSIRAWYVWPEVISRPIIISLWGLTGTGKTQLVRSLAHKLGFADRFVEVPMDAGSDGYGSRTIATSLEDAGLPEAMPSILLLDEFQRFRTVDPAGNDIKGGNFADVWTLLSDGRLAPDLEQLVDLECRLASMRYDDEHDHRDPKRPVTYRMTSWQAKEIRRAIKATEPLTEIMAWTPEQVRARIEAFCTAGQSWQADYSKLLIFVTGNLDEMYERLATRVEDCDSDADVFHRITQRLGVIDVKKALASRFRPEQIARLGNCHVVYPSLNRASYYKLINRACSTYLDEVAERSGVRFSLSPAVVDEIYDNAVFPAQGARPVFSTINNVLSNAVVDAALWARELIGRTPEQLNLDPIEFDIEPETNDLWCTLNRERFTVAAPFELAEVRRRSSADFRSLVAVHEAAHGVVYAVLTGRSPQEIRINVASFEGGYNSYVRHQATSRRLLRAAICVSLAGRAGEAMVFGDDLVTSGAMSDFRSATADAARYVRTFGFDSRLSYTDVCTEMEQSVNTDVDPTNEQIEALLEVEYDRAIEVLHANRPQFEELVELLLTQGDVNPDQFDRIMGFDSAEVPDEVIEPYAHLWKQFVTEG